MPILFDLQNKNLFTLVQCFSTYCGKPDSEWICTADETEVMNCKDENFTCGHEFLSKSLFTRTCYWNGAIGYMQLLDLEKTGKALYKRGEDSSIWFCNTPRCNNQHEFPKNYTINKNYYNEVNGY